MCSARWGKHACVVCSALHHSVFASQDVETTQGVPIRVQEEQNDEAASSTLRSFASCAPRSLFSNYASKLRSRHGAQRRVAFDGALLTHLKSRVSPLRFVQYFQPDSCASLDATERVTMLELQNLLRNRDALLVDHWYFRSSDVRRHLKKLGLPLLPRLLVCKNLPRGINDDIACTMPPSPIASSLPVATA